MASPDGAWIASVGRFLGVELFSTKPYRTEPHKMQANFLGFPPSVDAYAPETRGILVCLEAFLVHVRAE